MQITIIGTSYSFGGYEYSIIPKNTSYGRKFLHRRLTCNELLQDDSVQINRVLSSHQTVYTLKRRSIERYSMVKT